MPLYTNPLRALVDAVSKVTNEYHVALAQFYDAKAEHEHLGKRKHEVERAAERVQRLEKERNEAKMKVGNVVCGLMNTSLGDVQLVHWCKVEAEVYDLLRPVAFAEFQGSDGDAHLLVNVNEILDSGEKADSVGAAWGLLMTAHHSNLDYLIVHL